MNDRIVNAVDEDIHDAVYEGVYGAVNKVINRDAYSTVRVDVGVAVRGATYWTIDGVVRVEVERRCCI